jgi:hypothetical protein
VDMAAIHRVIGTHCLSTDRQIVDCALCKFGKVNSRTVISREGFHAQ